MKTWLALWGSLLVAVALVAAPIPQPPTDGSLGPVTRSTDGTSWAALAASATPADQMTQLVVNGVTYGRYRHVEMPIWAPKGSRWVASVDGENNAKFLLIDGKLWGPYDNVREVTFDATGAHLSFAWGRGASWFVWQDGKELGPFQAAGVIPRPDGWAMGTWGTSKDNKTTLFLGGKSWGPYDWVDPRLDWISTDGTSYVTRGYKKGVSYLLQDGNEVRKDNLKFEKAPGGGYWLSWGQFGGWMFLIQGKTYGPYNLPPTGWGGGGPFFFDDGKNWAISTLVPRADGRGDASQVILNGNPPVPGWNVAKVKDARGEAFTWFDGGSETDLVSSRFDGSSTTTTALYTLTRMTDGWAMTVAGKLVGTYLNLGRPVVLPDTSHWAVVAGVDGNRYRAIVDGAEGILSPAGVAAENLTLDPVGPHVTYHLRLNHNNLQAYQVTDNKVTGPFARAGVPQFAVNGLHTLLWSEPTKVGSQVLEFDGKKYGPFTGLRGGDRRYFDLENGHFVFQNKEKAGIMAVTDQGNFGPYEEVYPLSTGHRIGNDLSGLLWGFVGRLKGGKAELHVFNGFPGGGKTYSGVRLPSEGDSDITPDGQDWRYPLDGPKGGTLHNGVVTN